VADFAAANLIRELTENPNYKGEDFKTALEETFVKLEELLRSEEHIEYAYRSGCTACVCLIVRNSVLFCANAGDSRAVACRNDTPLPLSKDHVYSNAVERRRCRTGGTIVYNKRIRGEIQPFRGLGDLWWKLSKKAPWQPPIEKQGFTPFPEVKSFTLYSCDRFFIIGCDGLWEKIKNDEIIDRVTEKLKANVPISEIVEGILDERLESVKDNITCILVVFDRREDFPFFHKKTTCRIC